MILMTKLAPEPPDLQEGKKIVEQYLGSKGATGFAWSPESNTRTWRVDFACESKRYKAYMNHVSLSDLRRDPQRTAKLDALWAGRSIVQS